MKDCWKILIIIWICIIIFVIFLVFLDRTFGKINDFSYFNGVIQKCIDGDTLKVAIDNDIIMTVRVLGVDTFETKKNKQAQKQAKKFVLDEQQVIAIGKMAKNMCNEYWINREVELRCWKKDFFKRDLCYVKDIETQSDYGWFMIQNHLGYFVEPY